MDAQEGVQYGAKTTKTSRPRKRSQITSFMGGEFPVGVSRAELRSLRDAEEEVRRATAKLEGLRAHVAASAKRAHHRSLIQQGRPVTVAGFSCLHFLTEGCGRTLLAAEACVEDAFVGLAPQLKHERSAEEPLPEWMAWLIMMVDVVCGKVTCGMVTLVPKIEEARPRVRKSTTKCTQHDVLPSLTGCLKGDADVDLEIMFKGVRQMMLALEALGPWTCIAVQQMRANMAKIEKSTAVASLQPGQPRLLLTILDYEIGAQLHQPGGLLNETSAANGALWLLRFLTLWRDMWSIPRPDTFTEAVNIAYEKSLRRYHSWLVQNTFSVAVAAVPTWAEARDALDGLDAAGEEGLMKSIIALDPVLKRMEKALRERDMWDERPI